jgi:sialate O-acetylesterase
VNDVYLGEVWLCSGQSNMQFKIGKDTVSKWSNGVVNLEETLKDSNYPMIRMFTIAHKVADEPLDDVNGKWMVCNAAQIANFSAVAYFFGKEISKARNVPVGLINSSWGGTPAESWTKKEVLNQDEELRPILARYQQTVDNYPQLLRDRKDNKEIIGPESNKSPYKLFNGMIHPLLNYRIKGAIWYQGESNAERAYQYRKLFPAMVKSWRRDWESGDFPFYFVQISPHKSQNPVIRESQLMSMDRIRSSGMVVTTDNGDANNIHPRNKELVGKRLSYWALNKDYNQSQITTSGPLYKKMKIAGQQIKIFFRSGTNNLAVPKEDLKAFLIAGADRIFYPAQARVDGNTVVVWSDQVIQPTAVRFGWSNIPEANLFNTAGLPASPFRTDHYPVITEGVN